VFSEGFLLKGVAAPAIAAFVAALILGRVLTGSRGVGAIAFAIGQALGTGLVLAAADNWMPTRNLHYVPWLGLAAAALGPTIVSGGLVAAERWLLVMLAALGGAAFLVPTWPDLWPSRPLSMAAFVVAMALVARGTDGVTRRNSPRLVTLTMAVVSLLAAMLIAASFSLSLGEAALTTAAAISGTAAALLIRPDEPAVRGLSLPFTLTVGGWCYVTAIEPAPPLVSLLFLPAAPLMLWLTAIGPLSRLSARTRLALSTTLVALYLGAVGAWAWFSTEHEADPYLQASWSSQSIRD